MQVIAAKINGIETNFKYDLIDIEATTIIKKAINKNMKTSRYKLSKNKVNNSIKIAINNL